MQKFLVISVIGMFLLVMTYASAVEPMKIMLDGGKYFGDREVSLVLFRPKTNELMIYNPELANTRYAPCSTFKIISSLMGLECGVLLDKNTKLGYDGKIHEYETWNKDVTLAEAFPASCVWYYKKLTSKLQKEYVQKRLNALNYGNCDINVWNNNGHNVFWIESTLQISPYEAVKVMEQIFTNKSPFKAEHVAIVKDCMRYDDIGEIKFYGKTGSGRNYNTNRLEGSLMGFVELPDGELVFYASHMADKNQDIVGANIKAPLTKIIFELF